MDEVGHSGDPGTANGSTGGEVRDHSSVNGWASANSPWSNAGAALDPEEDDEIPAWRRPSQEIRPFTRQQFPPVRPANDVGQFPPERPSGELGRFAAERPSGDISRFAQERPSGELGRFAPERPSGEISRFPERPSGEISRFPERPSGEIRPPERPSGEIRPPGSSSGEIPPARGERPEMPPPGENPPPWSSGRARYADLLAHLSPNGHEPSLQPGPVPSGPPASVADPFGPDPTRSASLQPGLLRPEAPRSPGFPPRPDTLEDQRRTGEMRAIDAPPPASAPPYPYEGDLDDVRDRSRPPVVQQRAAVPLTRSFPAVRPAAPGDRRLDWNEARHALEPNTPPSGIPAVDKRPSGDPGQAPASYDPATYPRRFPQPEPAGPAPLPEPPTGYAPPTAYPGQSGRSTGEPGLGPSPFLSRALPQRVPAEPDVPTVPEPPSVEPTAETPALARIATHLRRGDVLPADERQEGFDVKAILEAVREVDGVRDASLRSTPTGAHSLRLDLAEGADPAEVSRQVARLLQDRMGLDAAMQGSAPPAFPAEPPAYAATPAPTFPARTAPPEPAPAAPVRATASAPVAPARAPEDQPTRGPQNSPAVPAARLPETPPAARLTENPPAVRLPENPQAGRVSGSAVADRPALDRPALDRSASDRPASDRPAFDRPAEASETAPTGVNCGPPRPLPMGERPGPRVMIENVQVNTFGTEATVEVRLAIEGRTASGIATGPAVDGYLLRLCATATTQAVDDLLSGSDHVDGPARCYVEHAASVPFGSMQVAVVVLLLSCGNWVEQLAGSAVVTGDDRHAMVRATLAAVNRRLEALLS